MFQDEFEQLRIAEREFIKNQVEGGVMKHYDPSPEQTLYDAVFRQRQEYEQSNAKSAVERKPFNPEEFL